MESVLKGSSEIASIVAQEGFWSLQAPIQKVASEQVHIPFSPSLEKLVYPDVTKASTNTAQAGSRFVYSSEVQQLGQLGTNYSIGLNYRF